MAYINVKIFGVPYAKAKNRGNTEAPKICTKQIIDQTENLPTVYGACVLRVTFLMPPSKFPKDFPFDPDIDNYLKRFQDALNNTIVKNVRGGDSIIMLL